MKLNKLFLLAGIAALSMAGPAVADTKLSLAEVIPSPERTESLKQASRHEQSHRLRT